MIDRVITSCTNNVFLLDNMRDIFVPNTDEVNRKKALVYNEMLARCGDEITREGDFQGITAEAVAIMLDIIDREFFGRAITDVFLHHRRNIYVRVVGDAELPGQGGSFSRSGDNHFISINIELIRRAFNEVGANGQVMICGCLCSTKLEVLQRLLEHELIHLVVYTNWLLVAPHGDEFVAVGFTFFRHTTVTHAVPLAPGVNPAACDGPRGGDDGIPGGRAFSVALRPVRPVPQMQQDHDDTHPDDSGPSAAMPLSQEQQEQQDKLINSFYQGYEASTTSEAPDTPADAFTTPFSQGLATTVAEDMELDSIMSEAPECNQGKNFWASSTAAHGMFSNTGQTGSTVSVSPALVDEPMSFRG